jgi:L-asparaginase
MEKILLLNTGGTFNKTYNPCSGELEITTQDKALQTIAQKWLTQFEVIQVLEKDSLDMNEYDREKLLKTIQQHPHRAILIVHGTDTIHLSAQHLALASLPNAIVFTGAMVPFSIDPIEATANLALAYGFLRADPSPDIYIAMHGHCVPHTQLKKNHQKGVFQLLK